MTPCPLCDSSDSKLLFEAAGQPAMLNALFPTKAAAVACPRVDLEFRVCIDCGFVWNLRFSPSHAAYDATYVNDQSCSGVFRTHLDRVREGIVKRAPDRSEWMLEVGCGQGGFLLELAERLGSRALGVDPACTAANESNRITFMPRLFDDELAQQISAEGQRFDVVCCRHVLEHLADPQGVLRSIRRILHPSRGVLYVEVPDVSWILEHEAFFDLFHEHCSLFSESSLRSALRAEGFDVTSIEKVFGGQYLAAFARAGDGRCARFEAASEIGARAVEHARALRAARRSMQNRFREIAGDGPAILWGAGAKSVSLLAHLRLEEDAIDCLVDVNPTKWRRFVAVSGREIIPPADLPARLSGSSTPATIVVMNPNYADEIPAHLESLEINARCLLLDPRACRAVHA
jgi:SAM-dependent methyltransferase